ncbi:tetratricopeptide repeat protein [bacterium SCSIO 12741]|nr:tetratricopeptide repeat protein [bacterium SCSIO 12741]
MHRIALLIVLIATSLSLSANDFKDKSYSELFQETKLLIASHKESDAIPLLEELYSRDKDNANVAYLLGLCYVKSYQKIPRAIDLLEKASEEYTRFYDKTSITERGVSEYVYYYLIVAYSLKGDCKKTIKTLNRFYKIYSYEDEWYLIDGQKWHRECGMHNWKDENDSLVEPSDTLPVVMDGKLAIQIEEGQPEQPELPDTLDGKLRIYTEGDPPVEDTTVPAPEVVEVAPPAPSGPVVPYHERLRRVGESGGPEVMTREVNYTARSSLFGVQVGAFIKPRYSKDFKDLKNVEVYIDNYGVFRYVIGRFVFRQQAEKLLAYVKDVGYQDAFIVDINSGENYSNEVLRVNNQSIKREISGEVDFRVQVGAFQAEIPDDIMQIYLKFDDIKENYQGDLTVFTIGTYGTYEIASAFCANIRDNGVPDAFVVAYNGKRKISIDEANEYIDRMREAASEIGREEEEKEGKKKKKKKN